jgi:hypothetical protein
MRLINKPWAIAGLTVAILSGVGVAIAQEDAKKSALDNAPPKEVSGGQDVNLAPPQMLERARGFIPEMDKLRATVAIQLVEAKKKKDVVKSLCLDDKVKQMKLATDTAKDRVVDLISSVSQSDPDRSKHEFTVIQVLHDRVLILVTEAQQCIGEETGFVGDSDITVNVDPALPDTDPSDFPEDPLVSEPPVLSSPTL